MTCKDLNTRFFHSSTLIRRKSNAIDFLQKSYGAWVSNRDEIGGSLLVISPIYSPHLLLGLMMRCWIPSLFLSLMKKMFPCAIPPKAKILQALSSLGSTKAPGPDGVTSLFYKKYWPSVRIEILYYVWDFFQDNILLKEQNHTFIALVPKRKGSHSVNHFRPINLCNIVYKIVSNRGVQLVTVIPYKLQPQLRSPVIPFLTTSTTVATNR